MRVKTQAPRWGWVTEVWSWPLLFLLLYSSEMWEYMRLYTPGRKWKWGIGILEQEDTGNQLEDLPLLPSAVCMAIGVRAIGGRRPSQRRLDTWLREDFLHVHKPNYAVFPDVQACSLLLLVHPQLLAASRWGKWAPVRGKCATSGARACRLGSEPQNLES